MNEACFLLQGYEMLTTMLMCYATLHPALPVRPSVSLSVCRSHSIFFMIFFTSLPLPKWSCDLVNGPCSPARDLGSRVSGLVIIVMAQSNKVYDCG